MKTTIKAVVKNWSLVTIKDELSPFQILWGIIDECECDESEYKKGDYLCSSRIFSIENSCVKTLTGSGYELIGKGSEYASGYVQLISLIDGLSPAELQLKQLKAGISPLELYK
jgi:hypothetical protein